MKHTEEKTVTLPMEQLMQVVDLQLRERGSANLNITGTSMRPMLYHLQDRVLLAPAEEYGKGDIILYRRPTGQYVLHRIIKKNEDHSICCGDNQWRRERVENTWVLAVVTDFYKKEKKYSINHKGYRLYVWLWIALFPVRRPILWVVKKIYRLVKKIFGGKK